MVAQEAQVALVEVNHTRMCLQDAAASWRLRVHSRMRTHMPVGSLQGQLLQTGLGFLTHQPKLK